MTAPAKVTVKTAKRDSQLPLYQQSKGIRIVRLWLNGLTNQEIQQRVGCRINYVKRVISSAEQTFSDKAASDYLKLLTAKVHQLLDNHTHIASKLIVELDNTSAEIDQLDHDTTHLSTTQTGSKIADMQHKSGNVSRETSTVNMADGMPDRQPADKVSSKDSQPGKPVNKTASVAGTPAVRAVSIAARGVFQRRLIELSKAINANNASLVDGLVKMGVSTIAASLKEGSHAQGSTLPEITDFAGKSRIEIESQIGESAKRQIRWLRAERERARGAGAVDADYEVVDESGGSD